MKKILSILILFTFLCCTPKPINYLNSALDIMEENSIYKDSIDWPTVRSELLQKAKQVNTIKEVHPLIREAILKLGDGHTVFLSAEQQAVFFNEKNELPQIISSILDDNIAYIQIPGFVGSHNNAKKFASSIIKEIEYLDSHNPSKWIVDLSQNTGGNMWPMFLGLSPLLDEGIHGYFYYPDKNLVSWKFNNDSVYADDNEKLTLDNIYRISDRNIKNIVVLIGRNTASSGEATTILFKGLKNVKFIGDYSSGLTTSNQGFNLKDGATIYLTTSFFLDRDKKIYGSKIEPDIFSDQPIRYAIEWLKKN